ncbi:COPII coat assembly protein SEC16-like, partial [Hibiscus syriacus]
MDFQSLTRKELQFLCKRNKIPANITNVAMADALNALELVEGLEELHNQSQSPEKTVNKEIPGTVTRTLTRRKPIKDEHQSTQSTIRTRKTARKTMGVEEENKNLNVPEVEVKDQRKSDMVETPLASGRSKVRAQKEGSLQTVYGTRRSVRLLGKSMAGLCIKESEKMPAKVDEMVEGEDGSNNGQSGATLELPLARNLSASLEDEREFKDDVEENIKSVNNVETDVTDEKLIPEDGSYSRTSNEKTEIEGEDKIADDAHGIIDPKDFDGNAVSEDSITLNEELIADKADDVAVSNDPCEIENLNERLVADETNHVADEKPVVDETKSIEVLITNAEDVPEEVFDQSSSAADMEAIHDDVTILAKAEEHADAEVSQNVLVLPAEGHMDSSEEKGNEESNDDDAFLDELDINNDTGSESKSLAEEQITADAQSIPDLPAEGHMDSSAKKGNKESNDDDAFLGKSDINNDTGSESKSLAEEQITADDSTVNEESDDGGSTVNEESDEDEDPKTNMVYEEALVDANVTEAETTLVSSFHSASQSIVDDIAQKRVNYGGSEALINVCVKPAEEFADTTLVSNSETITTSMPLWSPSKAQFSHPSKSSNKKETTVVAKVTQVSDNLNKENIVEKELAKQKLESLSLRQLRKLNKMFDKLEI